MSRVLPAVVIAASVLLPLRADSPAEISPSTAFAVGVLRADGGLIPIATYTGRRWDVTWPSKEITEVEIPITLASIPRGWWGKLGPREEWEVWTNGRAAGTVHPTAPAILAAECSSRLAMMTNYRPSVVPPPPSVQPYPKVGVAVSPHVPVDPIDVLTASSQEWTRIATTLKAEFDAAEDTLAAMWIRAGDPHPIDRKERQRTSVTIEAMYASGESEARVYFVEALRTYDHSEDDPAICATAFGGGFFKRERDGFRALGMDMRVVPCDRRGLVYMLPLGALHIGGKTLWIAQYSSWDSEVYQIIEFKRPHIQVVASTSGGRC